MTKNKISKSLVVGFGSIGQRHAAIMAELGLEVAVVSRREISHQKVFHDLSEAIVSHQPDLIVIANETNLHFQTLQFLNQFSYNGLALCEKPLCLNLEEAKLISQYKLKIYIAYNLRFHPLVQKLKNDLQNEGPVIHFCAYVGQHLPNWRPGRDYRQTYSASSEKGGGVLRDLSHEIDLCLFLFGKPLESVGQAAKVSSLEINTEDIAQFLWTRSNGGLGSISMNYLDRQPSRFMIVNTAQSTFHIDLMNNTFSVNGKSTKIEITRNTSYHSMLKSLIQGNVQDHCTLSDAYECMKLISFKNHEMKNDSIENPQKTHPAGLT